MGIVEGVRLALGQIRAQKLKSFFSVMGVVVGVMFLVTVVSVIEGMDRYVKEDFAREVYGLHTLTVRRRPSVELNPTEERRRALARRPRLTFQDAEAIARALGAAALVAVQSEGSGRVESETGTAVENVWLTGASGDYFSIREYDVERGRLFGAPEDRAGAPVVVLGRDAADKLFGLLDPIGRTVRIGGARYRVIGVLERQGTLFGFSLDNRAIAPARSPIGRLVAPRGSVDEILVKARRPEDFERLALEVEAILRVRHRLRPGDPNDFELETADDSLAFWSRVSRVLYVAFPGLVAIALVVGALVIMNIMLMAVAERTREIGIRKAVGARRRDILIQVLVESATLAGGGAAVGLLLGVGLAQLVRALSPLPAALGPEWVVIALALGIGVGIAAGLYPAARAARLDPVAALRHE